MTTIAGYRSMLTTTLREVAGTELSGNLNLTKLLANFSIERPRERDPFPTWDLALVLSRLQRGPYESLRSASMKFLSGKVAFLVALATAKRRSELRAFSKKILHHPNWKSVTLRPLPKFVAKTEVPGRPETRLLDVTFSSLRDFVDPDLAQDAVNCPVRAVQATSPRFRAYAEIDLNSSDLSAKRTRWSTVAAWRVDIIPQHVLPAEAARAHHFTVVATNHTVQKLIVRGRSGGHCGERRVCIYNKKES